MNDTAAAAEGARTERDPRATERVGTITNDHAGVVRRPRPVPTRLTNGFWAAAARRELGIQRCRACGRRFHPPVPVCSRCHSEDLGFEPVSGRGTIHSLTVMTEALVPGFEPALPLIVVAVELDEQEGLVVVSNLVGDHGPGARIGARVEVAFERLPDDGGLLPQFRVGEGATA
ncbi:Zn-ribbon domain-containing OB-fold protein [Parafrankia discariae]|uniref:Zn-ribbon domain-containing OB-fold protein n=1 Tax=Parafrankia discariae TaxID=365528 RepID=UPI0012B6A2A7|nr:OB-fold domain-containing protein [Parafrankia discariae]